MTPANGGMPGTDEAGLRGALENRDPRAALAAAARRRKGPAELAAMLSPGADGVLEDLARMAHEVTLRRFGRTIQLYIPLYISNRCVGTCPYCGFRGDQHIDRGTLTIDHIAREARAVADLGMRHILLVSGDSPGEVDAAFMASAIDAVKGIMHSVSVEVPPLSREEYGILVAAGLDGVTLYQETYDRDIYRAVHARGPKADFDNRLGALDRAGEAGVSTLTAGALWGLAPWREEALRLGLHAGSLIKRRWSANVQLGMPRLRQVPSGFEIQHPLDDRSLVHIVVAMRLYLEEAGMVLSTRESPALRDALVPLGITQMSAGSSTRPGGYSSDVALGDQFPVVDERPPREIAAVLRGMGYDPVWKDWDRGINKGGAVAQD
jgi:2-iminoacetate synthase